MSNKWGIPRLFTKNCTNKSRKSSTVCKCNVKNCFFLLSFLTISFFRDVNIQWPQTNGHYHHISPYTKSQCLQPWIFRSPVSWEVETSEIGYAKNTPRRLNFNEPWFLTLRLVVFWWDSACSCLVPCWWCRIFKVSFWQLLILS